MFFYFFGNAQNLIPNPGADDYIFCPTGLGGGNQTFPGDLWVVDDNIIPWLSLRGSPDYFNTCADDFAFPLGAINPLGYQLPSNGTGMMGFVSYSLGLAQSREHIGINFTQSLIVGDTYNLSFHVSLAYSSTSGANMASNNLGILFMTENYLAEDELGFLPNFSHFKIDSAIIDTTNWVISEFQFTADSAYSMLALGNFYDDSMTFALFPFEQDNAGLSYYFADNFCLSNSLSSCDIQLNIQELSLEKSIKIWPNPSSSFLKYGNVNGSHQCSIYSSSGTLISREMSYGGGDMEIHLALASGLYFLEIETKEEVVRRRFMVQH